MNRNVMTFFFIGILGGVFAISLPRQGLLDGSTRIIPFFALLMAGVFPAMMQTVTVLKGDDLSPKAVSDYGSALGEQLSFWASLVATALFAIGFLTLAVIIKSAPELVSLPGGFFLSRNFGIDCLLFAFGWSAALVFRKFVAAYGGLRSLLKLNLDIAQKKSEKTAKKKLDELMDKTSKE